MATTNGTGRRSNSKAARERAARERERKRRFHKQLTAICLFAVGILLIALAWLQGSNVWKWMHDLLYGLFGALAVAIGPLCIYVAVLLAADEPDRALTPRVLGWAALFVLVTAALHIFMTGELTGEGLLENLGIIFENGKQLSGGGLTGALLGWPLLALFGKLGAGIIIVLVIFILLMILTGKGLIDLFQSVKKPVRMVGDAYAEHAERKAAAAQEAQERRQTRIDIDLGPAPRGRGRGKAQTETEADADAHGLELPEHPVVSDTPAPAVPSYEPPSSAELQTLFADPIEPDLDPLFKPDPVMVETAPPVSDEPFALQTAQGAADESDPAIEELIERAVQAGDEQPPALESLFADMEAAENRAAPQTVPEPSEPVPDAAYEYPPVSLLTPPKPEADAGVTEELRANAELLVDTLKSFGVQTRIIDISRGPAVTRYELQPSAGVKISKITSLADDIALNLAAAGVRIEAPIPNKPAVGIEVPNKKILPVPIREVIASSAFEEAKSKLTFALGKDIAGTCMVADIAKMPHLLIAGSTGSGKSVCINSLIVSLLYKATPDEVRLLMIDPKGVELGIYNGIPHLLVPVVTDPRKAAGALGWAVTEMLDRYKLFAENSVRDLHGYNQLAKTREDLKVLPEMVIIIDELADLMMAAPNEVEDSICRLAQMARAAGMHLVIATQRPSVDVITGIIKANIPSRIAFAVSSQVDSRVILDAAGADKLLGRGDMLFYPVGAAKPVRVQGCFVSDKEVEQVVDFIKKSSRPEYDEAISEEIDRQAAREKGSGGSSASGDDGEGGDEMLPKAIECVVEAGMASTSLLQRRLKLGYARAARLIDEMEQRGIVGPFEGSKPRQVLMTKDMWIEMKMQNPDLSE